MSGRQVVAARPVGQRRHRLWLACGELLLDGVEPDRAEVEGGATEHWRRQLPWRYQAEPAHLAGVTIGPGESDHGGHLVDGEAVALLAHHLDRFIQKKVGEHRIDLALGKRYIEAHHGGVALDVKGGDAGPGSGEIDGVTGDRPGATHRLGLGAAASAHEHRRNHQNRGHDQQCNPDLGQRELLGVLGVRG